MGGTFRILDGRRVTLAVTRQEIRSNDVSTICVDLRATNRFRWLFLLTVLAIEVAPLLLSLVTISGGSTFDSTNGPYRVNP